MPPSSTNSQVEAAPNVLPLFRPEAIAAQERTHGEILLIRPLSLAFLLWLGIGLGAASLGFLMFGRVTDTTQVAGVLLRGPSPSSAAPTVVRLDLPASIAPFVQAGTSLVLRCPGCADPGQKLSTSVVEVGHPPQPGSPIRVTVALPPEALAALPHNNEAEVNNAGVALEVEVPLGRTSLIHWLLKPSAR